MKGVISKPTQLWAWWSYFWLSLLLFFIPYLAPYLLFGNPPESHLGFDVISAIGFIPLYGYLRQVPILRPILWQWFFALGIIAFLGQCALPIYSGEAEMQGNFLIIVLVLAFALLLAAPLFWANFAYAFRSPHLWKPSTSYA